LGKKIRDYEKDLWGLFWEYSGKGDFSGIREFLLSRSGLPGPRANLELATAFANVVLRCVTTESVDPGTLLSLCQSLCSIPPSLAPTGDPKEFLVFCGVCGLGSLGTKEEYGDSATNTLREMADDDRWRTREAVAIAVQRLMGARPRQTLSTLSRWIEEDDPFLARAVVAGIAEPRLLVDGGVARSALKLHEKAFEHFVRFDRKSEGFRVLRKALSYSLSVVVAAQPKEGFSYMISLASSSRPDVKAIVGENLAKKRLARYAVEVRQVGKALSAS
jgi:hypothetical protein